MHTPITRPSFRTSCLLAGLSALFAFPSAYAALPSLPRGDNTENILFQDDFDYNTANAALNAPFKNWSNIASGTGKATLGLDPIGSGVRVWHPSVISDQGAVTSQTTLPTVLDVANGPIALYMRVRVHNSSASPDASRFSISLNESSGNRFFKLIVRDNGNGFIEYRNASGAGASTSTSITNYTTNTTFIDFKVTLTPGANLSQPATAEAFRYNTVTSNYDSIGVASGVVGLNSGLFDKLSIWSRNATEGAVYFDSVMVTQTGSPRARVPANATYLPSGTSATIQAALNTAPHVVVLGPGTFTGTTPVVLNSNYRLYGDPAGTVIPPVTVTGGATGIMLSNVRATGSGVTFGPSSLVTSGNLFERIGGTFVVTGARLSDNFFFDVTRILIDNTAAAGGGYVRNNRFIRTKVHAAWPQLVMKGDTARNSYGNVFLWYNFLTPHGDATDISDQGDLTFVGVDAETWNQNGYGTNALFKIGRMGTFRVFTMNGGNHGSHKTGDFDVDADEFQIFNDRMEKITAPLIDYKVRANNLRSLAVNISAGTKVWENSATAPFRIKGFESSGTSIMTSNSSAATPVWTTSTGGFSTSPVNQQTILKNMIAPVRAGSPWESPRHGRVPDPAGPNWATLPARASQPDDAPMIQNLLDTSPDGIARLPAGTYYIGVPLKVRRNHGIIGAGADNTVIIAKTAIDMIVADDPITDHSNSRIVIADITLQGGKNGIHLEPIGTNSGTHGNPGRKAQYTGCYFSHVTFRDMTEAGIFMDKIYALDNIVFTYVHFVNCDTGLKQLCDPLYTGGETSTMMYMDKVVFYKSQFLNNRVAMDLVGKRGCNLNAWISCLFKDNSGAGGAIAGVARMANYLSPVFANCDFINNGGSTAVVTNNHTTTFVSCGFSAGANGAAMLGGSVAVEGSFFEMGGSTTARMVRSATSKVYFYNSRSTDMPLWTAATNTNNGVFMNNLLVPSDNLNKVAVSVIGTTRYEHAPAAVTTAPVPQMLFGSDWTANPVLPLLSEY